MPAEAAIVVAAAEAAFAIDAIAMIGVSFSLSCSKTHHEAGRCSGGEAQGIKWLRLAYHRRRFRHDCHLSDNYEEAAFCLALECEQIQF